MALTSNLPPQAYTRDTLVKAIEWLSGQPPSVRERANTADLVVSFYLQARRRTPSLQVEASVNPETFKADLHHLAKEFRQLEELPTPPSPPPSPASRPFSRSRGPLEEESRQESLFRSEPETSSENRFPRPAPRPSPTPAPAPSPPPMLAPQVPSPSAAPMPLTTALTPQIPGPHHSGSQTPMHIPMQGPASPSTPAPIAAPAAWAWTVDDRTLQLARKVQERLNLSSESEALRMLVCMGAERLGLP
ncbi:MAG: hypothetical protein AB7G93_05000 [Bdellovibrionales bacterium]